MKRMIKWIIVPVLAAAMLCGCSFGGMVENMANYDKYTAGDTKITDKVEKICIEWASGEVNVTTGSENVIVVREDGSENLPDDKKLHWWLDGTTLKVIFDLTRGFSIGTSRKVLHVEVPAGAALSSLEIDNASATVNVSGITMTDLEIDTASGDVNAAIPGDLNKADIDGASARISLNVSGSVKTTDIDTASGDTDIKISGDAGDVKISTASGKAMISAASARTIDIDTASGSVEAALDKVPEKTNIDTASGKVKLALPEASDFTLEYDTASGKFTSEIPLAQNGKTYTAGSGKNSMDIDTASGDIEIVKK